MCVRTFLENHVKMLGSYFEKYLKVLDVWGLLELRRLHSGEKLYFAYVTLLLFSKHFTQHLPERETSALRTFNWSPTQWPILATPSESCISISPAAFLSCFYSKLLWGGNSDFTSAFPIYCVKHNRYITKWTVEKARQSYFTWTVLYLAIKVWDRC